MKLFGGPIDWRVGKQKTVTTSTTEAELLALSHASKEVYYWIRFFKGIGLDIEHGHWTIMWQCSDSRSSQQGRYRTQYELCHVDIYNHWLCQEVQQKRLKICWISTDKMPADGLTKPLQCQKHENFINMLGLVDISYFLDGKGAGGMSVKERVLVTRYSDRTNLANHSAWFHFTTFSISKSLFLAAYFPNKETGREMSIPKCNPRN